MLIWSSFNLGVLHGEKEGTHSVWEAMKQRHSGVYGNDEMK